MNPTMKPIGRTISHDNDNVMDDGSMARLTFNNNTSMGHSSIRRHHVNSGMEESWNGLFAVDSLDSSNCCIYSMQPISCTSLSVLSAKKMGHTSLSDLGLYDAATKTGAGNGSATSVLPKSVEEETKARFMKKLRLNRIKRSNPRATTTKSNTNNTTTNMASEWLHQSDSALLRKDSDMDVSDLDGAWYKAKHPRRCQSFDKMAHSTGSLVS